LYHKVDNSEKLSSINNWFSVGKEILFFIFKK
jgi:hypothetical protein